MYRPSSCRGCNQCVYTVSLNIRVYTHFHSSTKVYNLVTFNGRREFHRRTTALEKTSNLHVFLFVGSTSKCIGCEESVATPRPQINNQTQYKLSHTETKLHQVEINQYILFQGPLFSPGLGPWRFRFQPLFTWLSIEDTIWNKPEPFESAILSELDFHLGDLLGSFAWNLSICPTGNWICVVFL